MSDENKKNVVLNLIQNCTEINNDAVELIEGILDRLKSGQTRAVAAVEVFNNNTVGTAFSKSDQYHQLNSGAARLAARLAND